jgi:hypothetical protein
MLDDLRAQPAFGERPRPLELYASLAERRFIDYTKHEYAEPPRQFVEKDEILEQVAYLKSLGVTITTAALGRVSGSSGDPVAAHLERLQWFAEEVMPEARRI